MPIDGAGNMTLVAGYLAVNGATVATTNHNPPLEDIATAISACIKVNGTKAFTAEQLLFANPVSALGAAPKQYVDAQALAAVASLKIKGSVLCVATTNLTLSAEQTIDGQLTSTSRVLVVGQTAPAENGIYVTGSGAWARATDFDAWSTEIPGAIVAVEAGTIFADTVWLCTADAGGTLNTTAITWRRLDNRWLRNAQTGTTYTVVKDDHNRYLTQSNASAIATTLPQATGNFGTGWAYISHNIGAGANTITPTTSTINGAATLIQRTGDCHFISSDGTNYRAIALGLTYEQLVGLTQETIAVPDTDFVVMGDVSALNLRAVKPQNLIRHQAIASKTAGYTVTTADAGKSIRFAGLSADVTLSLPSAASCGDGFIIYVSNEDTTFGASGPWAVTVDPNAAETIDLQTTRKFHTGTRLALICDGSNWRTVSGEYIVITGRQTISSGDDANIAHGQGISPKRVWPILECLSTEGGYSVGDFIFSVNDSSSAGVLGAVWGGDATNLFYVIANGGIFRVFNKTSGASVTLTPANWALRLAAAF